MSGACKTQLDKPALRLLVALQAGLPPTRAPQREAADALIAADLATRNGAGHLQITDPGRAYLARAARARAGGDIDPFRAQHLALVEEVAQRPEGRAKVVVDAAESPLLWLARRKGRDGRALVAPHQLQAGERLRREFTCALLMPRTTSNWEATVAQECRGAGGPTGFSEARLAARQRLRRTLAAVGPEFSGLLLDICCFLKRLEDVERERAWPARSAKIVLQLALERLARHYGYGAQASGRRRAPLRTWLASDAFFVADAGETDHAAVANAARASE